MIKWFHTLFKSDTALRKRVEEINALEPEMQKCSDNELRTKSGELRERAQGGSPSRGAMAERGEPPAASNVKPLDSLLPEAFALVREAAKRTLGQRHFDVQLMAGMVLHEGKITEMATGEGKTLAATAPAYLNALAGGGTHIVTVNEYLAKRDTVWMGQIYHMLGLSVACLIHEGARLYDPHFLSRPSEPIFSRPPEPILSRHPERGEGSRDSSASPQNDKDDSIFLDKERDITGSFLVQEAYLRPISRREAYQADILYGTNHEFGFDYLRDNLAYRREDQVQRGFNYAIIDEVDSILIDEARTPLIISAPDAESSEYYRVFSRVAQSLKRDVDYLVDEKLRAVEMTQEGIDAVEKILRIGNFYAPENLRLSHYLRECLRAHALFERDKDYVVKDGEVIIVDQFTGRLMLGRRYSSGLHQAIEAKEGVRVQQESRTYATISIQNYFRMYTKLAGMTGTAQTNAEEFDKVYKLEVVTIPTNRPMIRANASDLIYKTLDAKYEAVVKEIGTRQEKGQPVLVGTASIEKNEELSRRLNRAGIRHELLNAKNNEREGAIIAQAGKLGAVTVATNMAGRGVDIILGGNPPEILEQQKVRELGGLHVLGTERHEARRIDNQLRGRSGRQGDPGSSQFFLSLEDDLMRIFGGERLGRLMQTLKIPDDMPIESGVVSRAVGQAQARVEGYNFDARKHLLEYDDVLNKQRTAIYKKRQGILESSVIAHRGHPERILSRHPERSEGSLRDSSSDSSRTQNDMVLSAAAQALVLQMLDFLWMTHLDDMEHLAESVRLRAYGQHDPLVEYRREGHILFRQVLARFEEWVKENQTRLSDAKESRMHANDANTNVQPSQHSHGLALSSRRLGTTKVGRNEPCPCGAKDKDGHPIKYKRCHGK